jgi:hypothetical protein
VDILDTINSAQVRFDIANNAIAGHALYAQLNPAFRHL